MELFEGTVRMPGDPFELTAVLRIAEGRLRVTAREHELGSWALEDVAARLGPDGCHIAVEGEELIVAVPHPVRLVEAIGIEWADPNQDPVPQLESTPEPPPESEEAAAAEPGFLRSLPLRWKMGGLAVLGVAALWVFVPIALVGLLVVIGAALLLAGATAALDPFTSVQLPEPLTPGLLLGAGAGAVVVGVLLAVFIA